MIKVTIAIPVYNDDQFIERCIDSILNQTLDQEFIEIICVNDGSTDKSAEILENYAQNHSNVRVVHQENSGSPSGPRNKAIELAKGEYIYFVDADDYLGEEALERMYGVGEKYDCDIVVGKYKGINRNVPTAIFSRNPEYFTFFGSNAMYSISAQKMFKVSLLRRENIRFLENTNIGEDQPFTAPAYICSNGIGLVKDYDCYYLTGYVDSNRVQLTRQDKPFYKMHLFVYETLKAISSLPLDDEKVKRGLYQYWDRILNGEIQTILNRRATQEEKRQNFKTLSLLTENFGPGEFFFLFSSEQKIKYRLLEKGDLENYLDYVKFERSKKDYQIVRGDLYPTNAVAYELAIKEGLNFTRANQFGSAVTSAFIKEKELLIQGYQFHTRLSPKNADLSLKVTNRESKLVLRTALKQGMLIENQSFPLVNVPEGKEAISYFYGKIDLSFLKNIKNDTFLDFNIISKVEDYSVETRLKIDESYFEQTYYIIDDSYTSASVSATPYGTAHSNFSIKFREIENITSEVILDNSTLRMNNQSLKAIFEFKTKYRMFFEGIEEAELLIDGVPIASQNIKIKKMNKKHTIEADFEISKQDKKRISNQSKISLLVCGTEFSLENAVWIK